MSRFAIHDSPVLGVVLPEHEVVRGARAHEDDRRHVVEALNPLPTLVTLTADVEHAKISIIYLPVSGMKTILKTSILICLTEIGLCPLRTSSRICPSS